ncbi:983_t:CDS:2 [Entrophospora sp. SA101]|nr:983_t:CDS:2 [Entrophospora sp. SA101]
MQKQKLSNTTKLFTTSSSRSSCRPLLLPPSSPPPIIPPKSSRRPSSDSNHSDSSESNPNTIISHIVSTKLKCVLQCLLDCQQAMSEKKSPKVIRIYVKNFIEQFEQFELFITENNKSRIINLSSDDKKLYHEIGFFLYTGSIDGRHQQQITQSSLFDKPHSRVLAKSIEFFANHGNFK